MKHIISIVLFIMAILVCLLFGLAAEQWLPGFLLGLVFVLAGLFFYRRGK